MKTETLTLPAGSTNTHSTLTVWRFGTGETGKKAYLQASIHADEWPGMLVSHHLYHWLMAAERAGRITGEIVLVPVANPIGLRQFLGGYQLGRFDFDYSGNFNRGYCDVATQCAPLLSVDTLQSAPPAQQIALVRQAMRQALTDWQPLLESEHLRRQLQLLSHDADVVLDLHCDAKACAHVFANQRHKDTAEALATAFGAEVLLLEDDPGAMAFDEAAASVWWRLEKALGLPLPYATFAATVELRGEQDINDAQAQQDAAALGRFLTHMGLLADAEKIPVATPIATPLTGVARLLAPETGLIVFHTQVGEQVSKGQLVAELIDVTQPERARIPLLAPTTGKIYAFGRNHFVRPGHVVAQIAGQEIISTGGLAF